ncbi:hypothetical protein RRG08_066973 [Elysia crispata]|uniref:Uncharacterized protein n=1 Tax=Elysia crispata TaxID=231223 RepID=A0AAE0Z9W3_9GAST|nr:hypothetical protein RRG08_066973 [Elysia crispata]
MFLVWTVHQVSRTREKFLIKSQVDMLGQDYQPKSSRLNLDRWSKIGFLTWSDVFRPPPLPLIPHRPALTPDEQCYCSTRVTETVATSARSARRLQARNERVSSTRQPVPILSFPLALPSPVEEDGRGLGTAEYRGGCGITGLNIL